LFGDGHGNFQPPVTQRTFSETYPYLAQLADLDGDRKPDLILGETGKIVRLKNTGGGFAAPVTLATASANTPNFSFADFNGNGKLDILCLESDSHFHMLLNQDKGQFSDQIAAGLNNVSGWATVIDFDLGRVPDLIVQGGPSPYDVQLYSFKGNGDGSFAQVAPSTHPVPHRL
jgi:hypothetical protein